MTAAELAEAYEALGHMQYSGKRVVLVGGPLAAYSTDYLERILGWGATSIFIVATGVGTGPLPEEKLAGRLVLDAEDAVTVMDEFRATERMLADPPTALVEALDRWDPGREAVVLGDGFSTAKQLGGRPFIGSRPASFAALEDKVVIDRVWDDAGISRAPSTVVANDLAAVTEAFERFDAGHGVVLAADATSGWHGGAEGTRWARSKEEIEPILAEWSGAVRTVRVMAFLEGIPCSIHAIVFPDVTAVFRPCELLIYTQTDSPRFVYAGSATLWDPSSGDRAAMREAARKVGESLRHSVGYRGGLTIDGVMTTVGFLPTELNARLGAAFHQVGGALPKLSWGTIQRSLLDDFVFDYRSRDVERLVTEAADSKRAVRAVSFGISRRMESTETGVLIRDGDGLRIVEESDGGVATVMVGPNAQGYFARVVFEDSLLERGNSVAKEAARALEAVSDRWGLGIGRLDPCRSVR